MWGSCCMTNKEKNGEVTHCFGKGKTELVGQIVNQLQKKSFSLILLAIELRGVLNFDAGFAVWWHLERSWEVAVVGCDFEREKGLALEGRKICHSFQRGKLGGGSQGGIFLFGSVHNLEKQAIAAKKSQKKKTKKKRKDKGEPPGTWEVAPVGKSAQEE